MVKYNLIQEIDRLSDKIKHTASRIKSMEMELRQVKNRETARKFKPVVREHQKKIREFETQLQWSQAGRSPKNQYTAGLSNIKTFFFCVLVYS